MAQQKDTLACKLAHRSCVLLPDNPSTSRGLTSVGLVKRFEEPLVAVVGPVKRFGEHLVAAVGLVKRFSHSFDAAHRLERLFDWEALHGESWAHSLRRCTVWKSMV